MNNCGWVRNGGKCILEQENQQLKDNWNKLKEWLEENKRICQAHDNHIAINFIALVLDKIQEIEGGKK